MFEKFLNDSMSTVNTSWRGPHDELNTGTAYQLFTVTEIWRL